MMRNLMDFSRQLEGQNIVVDAFLDLKDNSIKGQIPRQTDSLILGETPPFGPSVAAPRINAR